MGFITSLASKLSKVALFFLLIAVLPGLPPYQEFEAFSVTPPAPLEGALALNSRLNNAERLFQEKIFGPEDIQVYDGKLYISVFTGQVVRVVGDKVETAVDFCLQEDGVYEKHNCGRPAGIAFDSNGKMYVANTARGIFKVDLSSGVKEILVSVNDTIEGKQSKLLNSVVVSSDGLVYWTDSSTSHQSSDIIFAFLVNGNGRLMKYNPTTKSNSVLLDKLHFPNGIAVSDDNSFLVVVESVAHRILKYHLKGAKAGQTEVFLDGLPGMPDNIHSDGHGGFVVSLIVARDTLHPSLIASLAQYPLVRRLVVRVLYFTQRVLNFLKEWFPFQQTAEKIGYYNCPSSLRLDRATVLFLNRDGKVTRSLYATDGLTALSTLIEHDGYYYMVSPFSPFLARVKAS